jgi:multiple sugar transport system ATP-binding protein
VTSVRQGERSEVWVDTGKIQVFEPASGKNLTAREATPVAAG